MKTPAAYQQVNIFNNIIGSLRELEFSFRSDSLNGAANHFEAVAQLLKAAKRLKKLKLSLTDSSTNRLHYSDEETMSDFGGLVETSNGTWLCRPLVPKLEALTIDACTCHDEELLHFLKLHCASLRRLELSNITLLGGEDRRECLVRLIKHLKTELRLESISFSGWFSNGGRQHWSVAKETIGSERLKARVENYVVDRRVRICPLERVAIKPNEGDVEKATNGEEIEGDLTWTMVYSNRYDVDWQPEVPSFGVHSNAISSHSSEAGDLTPPPGQSEADSWEDLEDVQSYAYADDASAPVLNHPSDLDHNLEMFDIGGGTGGLQYWNVLSTSPVKIPQVAHAAPPFVWHSTPVSISPTFTV